MTNPGAHAKHELIFAVVRRIPPGAVATYGQVAALAGLPGHARLAGYALFNLPEDRSGDIPWQRVINGRGQISYSEARCGNDFLQRELLETEGVEFDAVGRVSLTRYGWRPDAEDWVTELD